MTALEVIKKYKEEHHELEYDELKALTMEGSYGNNVSDSRSLPPLRRAAIDIIIIESILHIQYKTDLDYNAIRSLDQLDFCTFILRFEQFTEQFIGLESRRIFIRNIFSKPYDAHAEPVEPHMKLMMPPHWARNVKTYKSSWQDHVLKSYRYKKSNIEDDDLFLVQYAPCLSINAGPSLTLLMTQYPSSEPMKTMERTYRQKTLRLGKALREENDMRVRLMNVDEKGKYTKLSCSDYWEPHNYSSDSDINSMMTTYLYGINPWDRKTTVHVMGLAASVLHSLGLWERDDESILTVSKEIGLNASVQTNDVEAVSRKFDTMTMMADNGLTRINETRAILSKIDSLPEAIHKHMLHELDNDERRLQSGKDLIISYDKTGYERQIGQARIVSEKIFNDISGIINQIERAERLLFFWNQYASYHEGHLHDDLDMIESTLHEMMNRDPSMKN
jgi:hypothetical protein